MDQNRNIAIYFFGKLIPAFAQLLVIVFGIRMLGTENYGKYNLLYTTAMIVASLAAGWVQQGVLRYFYTLEASTEIVKGKFISLAFLSTFVSLGIACIAGRIYFNLPFLPLMAFSFFTAIYSLMLVVLTLFQAQFQATLFSVVESLFYCISIVFGIIYLKVLPEKDYTVFLYAVFHSVLIIMVTWFMIIIYSKQVSFEKIGRSFFLQIFRYGFPLTVWSLISNTFNVVDRYVIEHFYGYEAVGIYGSVYDLIYKVSGFLTLPLLLAFHPAVAKFWSENKIKEVKMLMKNIAIKEVSLGVFIFTILFLFKEVVFVKLLKLDMKNFYVLFIPLAISSLLWQICLIMQKPLEFNLRQGKMIAGILLAISFNFILNIILVPLYGIYACGFTTLITTLIYFIFVYHFARKEFKIAGQYGNKA